jgi:hypothetical protein
VPDEDAFDPDAPTVELTPADVEQYLKRRLLANDPETARVLRSALRNVRKYCGWRVTPVKVETVTLDGPGGTLLSLPTRKLLQLQSISENGVALDVDSLDVSRLGFVEKRSGARWSGRLGAITVTMNHGDAMAHDWQSAVLELIDRASSAVGEVSGNSGPLIEKKIDDVTLRWMNSPGDPANQALFDMLNRNIVDPYRIEVSP